MSPVAESPTASLHEPLAFVVANPFVGVAGVVYILLPQLSPTFLAAPEHASILSSAQLLAPICQGGFECRLADDSTRIDLQQYIHRNDAQQGILRTHLATMRDRSLSWGRLGILVNAWLDKGSSLSDGIEDLWIELDNDGSNQDPNVFIGLPPTLFGAKAYATIVEALARLFTSDAEHAWRESLRRCFEACPPMARVSHVGVMLGRDVQVLRINVKGLFPTRTLSYLRDIGWNGPEQLFTSLHEELAMVAEQATLCLDIGASIKPTVGLECAIPSRSGLHLWWNALCDVLIDVGLCTPAKKSALMAWPGAMTTMQSHTGWPADLIAESLWQKPNRFGLIRRSISHVKVAVYSATNFEAKAYLWFNHEWVSAA